MSRSFRHDERRRAGSVPIVAINDLDRLRAEISAIGRFSPAIATPAAAEHAGGDRVGEVDCDGDPA
jgi:hypothetical protein